MAAKYRLVVKGRKAATVEDRHLPGVVFRRLAVHRGRFRIDGQGNWMDRPEARRKLIERARRLEPGHTVEVGNSRGWAMRIAALAVAERAPAFDISGGNQAIQHLCRVSAGFDLGVRSAGIANTRKIAGSSSWSQHSRWAPDGKSNAVDFTFPLPWPVGNNLPRQRRLVAFHLAHAAEWHIEQIISEGSYYARENGYAPRPYHGQRHVSHEHVEMSPTRTGWPVDA